MALYTVAGLTQQIELPVPLIIDLLPFSQYHRPGTKRQLPGYGVVHETGNPNAGADALMHSRYLKTVGDVFVSWHFTVDSERIVQHVPINEITYQAADGNGPGNLSGISAEHCINADGDEAATRHNGEALFGGIFKALGMGIDRLKRHYDFNADDPDRHHCPDNMMNDGYWDTFVGNVAAIITPPVPVPTYAVPAAVPWRLGVDTGWQVLNGLNVYTGRWGATAKRRIIPRAFARDDAPQSADAIPIDARLTITGDLKQTDGVGWAIDDKGNRFRSSGLAYDVTIKKRSTA